MKKVFNLFMIAVALIAVTMTSCGKDEMDINLKDNTENSFTIKVMDDQTGNVIEGATIKNSRGETVATTGANGMATYTKKAGDQLLFTVEASGYAAMVANTNVSMSKLDAKLSGIATYTDKQGNLNVVPSGTEISIQIYDGSSFVQQLYKTQVGREGKFEFTSLPKGVYFNFASPATIGNNTYGANQGFETERTTTITVNYSYIDIENELPFAIVARPAVVKATGNIVITFNKEVNTGASSVNVWNATSEWSSDKKTVIIRPDTNWGSVGNNISVDCNVHTPAVDGERETINTRVSVKIVE